MTLDSVYSTGFDCNLNRISLKDFFRKDKQAKAIDLNELLVSVNIPQYEMPKNMSAPVLPTPAYAYDLHIGELNHDILLSLETGHIIAIEHKFPQPIRYCFQPHGTKLLKAGYCQFDVNLLVTMSIDKTWAIWDPTPIIKSEKKFSSDMIPLLKIKCPNTPNTILTLPSKKIIIGDVTPALKVYSI